MGNHNATQNVLAELRGPDDCENTPSAQLVGKAGWSAGHNHVSTERNSLGNSPQSEIWCSALRSEEPTKCIRADWSKPLTPTNQMHKRLMYKTPKGQGQFILHNNNQLFISKGQTVVKILCLCKKITMRLQILRPALYTASDRLALEIWLVPFQMSHTCK